VRTKTTGSQRILSLLTALVLAFSILSTSFITVAAEELPEVDTTNISISGKTGYYVQDGTLYQYDTESEKSTKVDQMKDLDADYVLYDGETLYLAGANMVVAAYDTADWTQKWVYDKQDAYQVEWTNNAYCQPNAEMVIKDDSLYVYGFGGEDYNNMAAVLTLDKASGEQKALKSETYVYGSKYVDSTVMESGDDLIFTGSTFTVFDTKTGEASFNGQPFDGSMAYESSLSAMVGVSGGELKYAPYSEENSITQNTKAKEMAVAIADSDARVVSVTGVPVVFSVEEGKVVYGIFTGVGLVEKETGISAQGIASLSVIGTDVYLFTSEGVLSKTAIDLSGFQTHQKPSEKAKELDNRLDVILTKISNWNGVISLDKLTLEDKDEISAIEEDFKKLDASEQQGVFNRSWIQKLKTKTAELTEQLNGIIDAIAKLPVPKDLVKNQADEVKTVQSTYNSMSDYDKTLVENYEKLASLLEKVAAYDVIDTIAALPVLEEITLDDITAVQAARKAYDAVADQWKGEVTNFDVLKAAEEKLAELMGGYEMGEDAYWASFGKDSSNTTVVDSKLPTALDEMEIILNGQTEKLSVKEPIIVGERLYFISGKQLLCYDLKGNRIAAADLYDRVGFFSRIAYGDGKIFVALSDRLQAFDAKTLSPLWLTPSTGGAQLISTITYHDGYLYTGYTSGGGGSTDKTDGAYFCVSTKDEDVNNSSEVKEYTWVSETGGYYWAGGVVVGDKIYFVGDSGILYSHHLTRDIVYDTYDLGDQVRVNLIYDTSINRLIVATKYTAILYTIELNADGTFNRDTIKHTNKGDIGGVTGGVASYNGRIYVPSGGLHSSGDFTVLDADTLKPAYGIEGLKSQSIPLVTTAYASAENNYKVYVYAVDYTSGTVFVFEDSKGQTEYKEVFKLQGKQTIGGEEHKLTGNNSASLKADQYGNLYFIGGSNTYFGTYGQPDYERGATSYALSIFRNTNGAFTAKDVENAISILPDDITYDNKKEVLDAKTRFDALTGDEQAEIKNSDKLLKAVDTINRLTAQMVSEVTEKINQISDPITLADEKLIEETSRLYGALLEDDKALVENRDQLKAAIDALFDLKASVAGLIEKIDTLPEKEFITLEHQAMVNELWAMYEGLSDSDKEQVTNIQKLLDAKDKMKELNDKALVAGLITQIDALPDAGVVTLAEEEEVTKVYESYDALHPEAKKLVSNARKLLDVYETVIAYRAAVDEIDDLIWNKLDPLNITLKDKAVVKEIMEKYHALRPQEQDFVQYYSDVETAQAIIASLEKGVIPKIVFENIMGMADRNYTAEGDGYTISFNGANITAPADFRYGVTLNPAQKEELTKLLSNAFVFGFEEINSFPGKATLIIETDLADGTYQLYRYNTKTNQADQLQTVAVKDKKATVTVERGGVYGLDVESRTELPATDPSTTDQPGTGENALPAAVSLLLSISSLLLLFLAVQKKRKLDER
jgi:hypothetical protein